ncbi:hypothetical protein GH714_016885 [Hevea brasiliensis]|uniref:histidinol dehydrogenase n=1 Tax=Hevea brasiliensis TaxID=3981 RepID=A0A6A6ME43_HEVBR|nr:hypothetical protein GH714_016885 [Hevea brasiliensis]
MVEEEEEKLLTGKDLSPYFDDDWNYEEESNDENQDSNIVHQTTCPKSPVEAINQKLEAFDLKDGYDTFSNAVSPRNPTVRRSLCFDGKNGFNMRKKHRVFTFAFEKRFFGGKETIQLKIRSLIRDNGTDLVEVHGNGDIHDILLLMGLTSNRVRCAMKSYQLPELTRTEVESLKARPRIDFSSIFNKVNPIVDDVRSRGDAAVKEVLDAKGWLGAFLLQAFLYVPGGTAVLPSKALMLSVPAQIARCKTIVHATPPSEDGAYARRYCTVPRRRLVSLTSLKRWSSGYISHGLGTESCPKVEKIFGPGNQYVTAAKMILQNSEAMISIDMPAGPSEVLVIADRHASPVHIAADLLSQAENGPDSQVVPVIVGNGVDLKAIEEEIIKQCQSLPRGEYASKALSHSFTCLSLVIWLSHLLFNLYPPEHLIVNLKDSEKWENFIENAGSVFLGQWTPESVGDYASGTNHVLPTYGYARMYGGASLDSFLKYMTVQSLTEEGLRKLGPYVATMAEVEGLEAHKRAVTLRLQDIESRQDHNVR